MSKREMPKRFENALFIQGGACNPSGIAHALVSACRECIDEGVSQRTDPAVRLIVHQLAFICDASGADDFTEYCNLMDACRTAAKAAA